MRIFHVIALSAGCLAGATLHATIAGAQTQATATTTSAVDPAKQSEAAQKRAAEKQKLANCSKQADAQKILVRDRTKFLIDCIDK